MASSSTSTRPLHTTSTTTPQTTKSYFEQQREALLGDISIDFEHVLANINKLNRSLEGVVAVGNEFSSVEALWSQFESVMVKEVEVEGEGEEGGDGEHEHEGEDVTGKGDGETR